LLLLVDLPVRVHQDWAIVNLKKTCVPSGAVAQVVEQADVTATPGAATVSGPAVNAELVRLGYARASSHPPDIKYQDLFRTMQQEG
jgi:hypothetical protein